MTLAAREAMFAQKTADVNTKVRVNVAVVVRDLESRILLEKRSDCGMWGLPGGRIEPGESITDAAVREMLEETGFQVKITRLLGVYSGPEDRIVTFSDNVVQVVDILLEAEIISGILSRSFESLELEFFSPDKMPPKVDVIPVARVIFEDIVMGNVGVVR